MNEPATRPGTRCFHHLAKLLVVLGFALHAFNIDFLPLGDGIDSSWQYWINEAAHRGRPFVFTCGPLGFINYPMNVGANLEIATVARLLFWLAFSALFGGLVWRGYFPWSNAAIFVGVMALLGPLSFDYFLCLLGLILLALALEVQPWRRLYGVVLVLSAFLMLMKLSAGLLLFSSCIVFVGLQLCTGKTKALQALLLILGGGPLAFGLFYLAYDPSPARLWAYLHRGLEITSGYSVAMSLNGLRFDLGLALLLGLTYLVMLLRLYVLKERSFKAALLFIPPLFFAFKHSFVRQHEHLQYFFVFTPLLMALVLLFTPLRRTTIWPALLLVFSLICSVCVLGHASRLSNLAGLRQISRIRQALAYDRTKQALTKAAQPELAAYTLPEEWQRAIGPQTVSIFPIEAAYAPANPLNFQTFPVVQAYAAYTGKLDRLNASHLTNSSVAPEFILMEWLAIDRRHPLVDVPATWQALYQWYDAKARQDDPHLVCLLQRRTQPRFQQLTWLGRHEGPLSAPIEIPRSDHPIVMKLSLRLTLAGQLANIFFRVPKVTLELAGPHGYRNHRVIPDTLENGVFINYLPLGHSDFYALMTGQPCSSRVDRIKLKGEGLACYQNQLQIEFYIISALSIREEQSSASQILETD